MNAGTGCRRMGFLMKNNKAVVFIFLLIFSIAGFYVFTIRKSAETTAPQRFEDSFPPVIEVLKENQVMTPEEKEKRRREAVARIQLRKEEKQKDNQLRLKEKEQKELQKQQQQQQKEQPEKKVDKKKVAKKKESNLKYKETQKFQAVKENKLYIYSAYLDRGHVRILGYKAMKYHGTPKCQFLLEDSEDANPPTVEGSKEVIQEHHSRRFAACYLFCKIPPEVKEESILAVKVTPPNGPEPGATDAIVPVYQTVDRLEKRDWQVEFSVCIAPMQNKYNNVHTLVEMIELNKILGAEKFFFYIYEAGENVTRVLNYYKDQGVVETIDWPIQLKVGPDEIDPDIHYFGQLIAHNDCLYRNRQHSKYIVIQDLDEFIIPIQQGVSGWKEIIQLRRTSKELVVFQFKNCFFRVDWGPKDGDLTKFEFDEEIHRFKSVVLSSVYREKSYYIYNDRSKCIMDPLGVETMGIHNIWKKYGKIDKVPESQAYLHHYRNYKSKNPDGKRHIHDESVLTKYGIRLVESLKKTWGQMRSKGVVG